MSSFVYVYYAGGRVLYVGISANNNAAGRREILHASVALNVRVLRPGVDRNLRLYEAIRQSVANGGRFHIFLFEEGLNSDYAHTVESALINYTWAQNYNLNRGHFGSEVLNGMNPNSLQGRADLIAYYGQRLDQRIRDGPIGLGWTEASYRAEFLVPIGPNAPAARATYAARAGRNREIPAGRRLCRIPNCHRIARIGRLLCSGCQYPPRQCIVPGCTRMAYGSLRCRTCIRIQRAEDGN